MKNQKDSLKRVAITISPEHGEALRALSLLRHKSQKQIVDEIFGQSAIIEAGSKLLRSMRREEPTSTTGKPTFDRPKQPCAEMPYVTQHPTALDPVIVGSIALPSKSEVKVDQLVGEDRIDY